MALQQKPLRMLYRKYAAHAPKGDQYHNQGDLISSKAKSESLSNLHLLGREFTKMEKVHMFFAMSDDAYMSCTSQSHSTVGSASTNGRSCKSKKDAYNRSSPTRFRSKSQEFQNIYRLAAARLSPDQNQGQSPSTDLHSKAASRATHLPRLYVNNKSRQDDNTSSHGSGDNARPILQVLIDERKQNIENRLKPAEIANYQTMELSDLRSSSLCSSSDRIKLNRVNAGQLQRCQITSPVDTERIDSSHYQYLFDDFTSFSSSGTLRSVKSDPASTQASARAQRPSTTGTMCTAQRLRDLHTCTTGMTTPVPQQPLQTSHSTSKSPEQQWPPRYATLPSWPSYEDIQNMNSCGEHRSIMNKLYRQDSDVIFGRRTRERATRVNFWNKELLEHRNPKQKKVHVVPSHTNMECAMCHLYKHQHTHTSCPPNTPMIMAHDCHDVDSHLSTDISLRVNKSILSDTPSRATFAKSASKRFASSSHSDQRAPPLVSIKKCEDSSSTPGLSRSVTQSSDFEKSKKMPLLGVANNSKNVDSVPKRKGVSYSWDTCKLAYVKANA